MAPNVEIDLLRAFLTVADSGSFTAAARALHRTQSAVSMQIKRLEEVLGCQLFERSSRRVMLTEQGESLFSYARQMVALNDEMLDKLRGDSLAGTVRLGVIEDYATHTLPPLLASFLSAHPGVRYLMQTGFTDDLLAQLGTSFDLVLGMHPKSSGKGRLVRTERAVWAGSRQHSVQATEPVALALHPGACQFRRAALAALDKTQRTWRLCCESESMAVLEGAARAGLAITIGKAGSLAPGLVALGADSGLPELPEFDIALHLAGRTQSPAAGALEEFLARTLWQPAR